MKIKVINGVNLNFLGIREKNIYGNQDYASVIKYIKQKAEDMGVEVDFFQSNCEGEIVDCLQDCYFKKYDGIVINPGAYTHYSYAIYDAIKSVSIDTVEVHISDINKREKFRSISVTAPACVAQIKGHGIEGYIEAIQLLLERKNEKK